MIITIRAWEESLGKWAVESDASPYFPLEGLEADVLKKAGDAIAFYGKVLAKRRQTAKARILRNFERGSMTRTEMTDKEIEREGAQLYSDIAKLLSGKDIIVIASALANLSARMIIMSSEGRGGAYRDICMRALFSEVEDVIAANESTDSKTPTVADIIKSAAN